MARASAPRSATWTVTPRCARQWAVSYDPPHRRWKGPASPAVCAPRRAHGSTRPGTESARSAHPSPHDGCRNEFCRGLRARMQVVVTASSLAHLPAIAALFTPFAGRTSAVAPSPQSGITRVMRERAKRWPLIASGALGMAAGSAVCAGRVFVSCMCLRWSWRRPRLAGPRGQAARLAARLQNRFASGLRLDRCPPLVETLGPSGRLGTHQLKCRAASPSPRNGSLTCEMRIPCRAARHPAPRARSGNSTRSKLRVSRSSPVPRCPGERA